MQPWLSSEKRRLVPSLNLINFFLENVILQREAFWKASALAYENWMLVALKYERDILITYW